MGVCLIIRTSGGTDTSGATATAARVLSGYTCYVNDVKITGTMANQGTKTASLNAGGSYTIPAGYHSGSGKVTANALSGQTSGTATAARILSGRTAWVNGSKLTGSMTNRGAISQKLAANGSYTVPVGWHNGSGKVTQSLTTQGAKNVTPKTTNQTACAASRWTTGSIVILGSSNLKAANIKKGVKIFNVTGTFTGWVDSTMAMSAVPSWTIVKALDTDWHWYAQNYRSGTLVYTAWNTGNSSSLTRIKWLVSNGFRPAITAVWQQTKRGSNSGNVKIRFSVAAIRIGSSGGYENNMVIGNNSAAFGGAYYEEYYNYRLDTAITSTWVCTAANGFTRDEYPYEGETYWIAGFEVSLLHPTSSGQGKLNSVSLYWTK